MNVEVGQETTEQLPVEELKTPESDIKQNDERCGVKLIMEQSCSVAGCPAQLPVAGLAVYSLHKKLFGSNNTNYDRLLRSMENDGYWPTAPIYVLQGKENFEIICGLRRLKAAGARGFTTIPAVILKIDSKDTIKRLMIEDNLRFSPFCREFSDLERYLFSVELAPMYENTRGGNHRSAGFRQEKARKAKEGTIKTVPAAEIVAQAVGLKSRNLSKYAVVTDIIIKVYATALPPKLKEKSEQLRYLLSHKLCKELTALNSGKSDDNIDKLYLKRDSIILSPKSLLQKSGGNNPTTDPNSSSTETEDPHPEAHEASEIDQADAAASSAIMALIPRPIYAIAVVGKPDIDEDRAVVSVGLN